MVVTFMNLRRAKVDHWGQETWEKHLELLCRFDWSIYEQTGTIMPLGGGNHCIGLKLELYTNCSQTVTMYCDYVECVGLGSAVGGGYGGGISCYNLSKLGPYQVANSSTGSLWTRESFRYSTHGLCL